MAITLDGTTGITSPAETVAGAVTAASVAATGAVSGTTGTFTGTLNSTNTFGFKNRIFNGGMDIDQRNAGASVTANSGVFPVDRCQTYATQSSKLTCQQSTTVPANFKNSVLYTSSSAYSVLVGDYFSFTQRIEGFNVADFNFGTAGATTVTLSFWVRSSLTGTFGGACHNSAFNRVYPFSYTIIGADTWQQKTVTIVGDTSGTWLTDNSVGLEIGFSLGCGSTGLGTASAWAGTSNIYGATGQVNLVGTNGATFYITGVQLEKSSTATSFDYRPYGTELALCQRYYTQYGNPYTGTSNKTGSGLVVSTSAIHLSFFSQAMRSTPSATYSAGAQLYDGGVAPAITSVNSIGIIGTNISGEFIASSGGLTVGRAGLVRLNASTDYIAFSSEL